MQDIKIINRKTLPGLWGLFSSTFLLQSSMSMIGIFIPIYIFKATNSLAWTFLFYVVYHFTNLAFALPSARLIAKFGSDRAAIASTILRIAVLILLIWGQDKPLFFLISAVIWGISIPLYWLPYHLTVIGISDGQRFGQTAAKLAVVDKIGCIAGPIIGGLIIQAFGFETVYHLAIILLLATGIPLLFDKYEFKYPDISFTILKKNLFDSKMKRFYAALVGNGFVSQIYDAIWPLYVFLTIGSFKFLGTITSIGIFASFILLIAAGKIADRKGNKILPFSAAANMLNLASRTLFSSGTALFIIDLLYQLVSVFVWIPLERFSYQNAINTKKLEFFLSREIFIHAGSLVAGLILFFAFGIMRTEWSLGFILGAAGFILIGQLGLSRIKIKT
ncbi:MAG: MFS transporter [bacterium]|nr:MFS transporter [bacterium]